MIWKFYLEDGGYTATEIENPVGWADAVFNFKRDKILHGVFFEYSIPLKFYGLGYNIIKTAYDADGVEAYQRIIIDVQCNSGDDYVNFYTGKLNFTKVQFQESDVCFVEVVIEDDSCLSAFKNRQDQEVELSSLVSLDGETMEPYEWINKEILLPSKTILKTDEWLYADEADGDIQTAERSDTGIGLIEFEPYIWLKTTDVINELNGINEDHIAGESDSVTDVTATPLWVAQAIPGDPSPDWVFNIRQKATISLTAFLTNLTLDGCGTDDFEDVVITLQMIRYRPSDLSTSVHTIDTDTFSGCHATFNEAFDYTFSGAFPSALLTGDEVSMYWRVQVSGTYSRIIPLDPSELQINFTVTDQSESYFRVTLETNYASTNASVSMVNEALSRITESITNKCLRAYSDYFGRTDSEPYDAAEDGCGSLEVITNGLLIRRNADASHRISFKKLFDSLSAIHNLGVGIETDTDRTGYDRLRIEQADYFYDDTVVLICDKVPDIKRTVITDEHYSTAEFGYQKWEAEEFSGLDEFNTSRKYRTSLKNIRNSLVKISELIASGYAIEITRQQFSTTSKDWRYDNDDFIICVTREYGGIAVEQGNIDTPANIIDPDTVYNYRISPIRNLLRWMNKVMAGYVDPSTSGSLYFTTGTGNTLAEGLLEDGCVLEDAVISEQEPEITVNTLATPDEGLPIYKLESWEFEYPLSFDDYSLLKANPRGIIQVRYGQQTDFQDCYLREIEYRPNQGLATFVLLPLGAGTVSDFILQENGDYLLQEDSGKLRQD